MNRFALIGCVLLMGWAAISLTPRATSRVTPQPAASQPELVDADAAE